MRRREEQRALTTLQVIILVVVVGTLLFFLIRGKGKAAEKVEEKRQEEIQGQLMEQATSSMPQNITFDPNTADSLTFILVGLSPYQAKNIIRYRENGGQYHRPNDIKRVYGMTVGQWEHIAPLIRIAKKYQYLSDNENVYVQYHERKGNRNLEAKGTNRQRATQKLNSIDLSYAAENTSTHRASDSPFYSRNRVKKLRAGEHIDLNNADTTTLQSIPGIGPYYARCIAEYRRKLGGFVSLSQLQHDNELGFLPIGIEQYLTINSTNIKKLRINHLSVRELNQHPYITYPQARQINERVRLYGPIPSWNDLLFLSEFSEKDKERLEPYVSFE